MKKQSFETAYVTDIAKSYDLDREGEDIWKIEQQYMEKATADFFEGAKVLDIPVGTGRFIPYYEKQNLKVLGIDISEAMLGEAAKKISSEGCELVLGDARAIDAADRAFEYVVCWRLLHLLPDDVLEVVIKEISRVAASRLYFQAYVRDESYYFLRVKNIFTTLLHIILSKKLIKSMPWSHIASYAHHESRLLKLFKQNSLLLKSIDVLGDYGALRVKVYVLEKS